jgi:hypothetical protein
VCLCCASDCLCLLVFVSGCCVWCCSLAFASSFVFLFVFACDCLSSVFVRVCVCLCLCVLVLGVASAPLCLVGLWECLIAGCFLHFWCTGCSLAFFWRASGAAVPCRVLLLGPRAPLVCILAVCPLHGCLTFGARGPSNNTRHGTAAPEARQKKASEQPVHQKCKKQPAMRHSHKPTRHNGAEATPSTNTHRHKQTQTRTNTDDKQSQANTNKNTNELANASEQHQTQHPLTNTSKHKQSEAQHKHT